MDRAFLSRADNHAQDKYDRFIYRTSDDTLWFDQDGTGTKVAIKIADLSNDFALTAHDIVIV
jgi:Ca2+-binding RTX toxin-like protein